MIHEVLPNIPREWTAAAEWGACLVYVLSAWRPGDRRPRALLVLVLALPGLALYQRLLAALPLWLWLPGMLGAVALMWLVLSLALHGSTRRSSYLVVRAFVVAELVASLEWQLELYFLSESPPLAARLALLIGVDVVLLAAVYLLERRQLVDHLSPTGADVAMSAAIAAMTFALSNLSFLSTASPFSGRLSREIFYIRTLVDLCGFVVLYAQRETARQVRAARELATSQAMLTSQYEQYLASKRAMDVVNRRYHDLRNLITAIRAETDPAARQAQLGDLEDSVRDYEAFTRTGSPVLDVILTDKGQACLERDITLRSMADGGALLFISPLDMAAIFGNALDNAIEASEKVHAPEERAIRLDVRTRRGFVVIEVENTVATAPIPDPVTGLLATTKPDHAQHGFGLASITQTVHALGGEASAGMTEEGTFRLRVLIPMPDDFEPARPGRRFVRPPAGGPLS